MNPDQESTSVHRSQDRLADRIRNVPPVEYDDELPIVIRKQDITDAIRDHQVVIVCGETGSGKSTQLPKMCLEMGRGVSRMIGHTQPRRIAARSVAARVAEELKRPLGKEVGFKIRFTDSTSPATYIKLMTDGILLAETSRDRFLNRYDTIIIDEAHERSLNIDFLIGYIKRLLPKRRDLRVIITSATIDAERFSNHFSNADGPATVIEVSGRTYPVEIVYQPQVDEDEPGNASDPDWLRGVLDAVDELGRLDSGDVLVFMPTERDIHETAKSLRGRQLGRAGTPTEILPLYARLSTKDQNRVFQPKPGQRRVVIATNVAESSLTVPGIRYVIDTGTARISRYSTRSKMQRLPIEPISRASADQRAGRCGRLGPGICIRLYSQQDYESRDRYTAPEIQRTNLASVILQTIALKLGDISRFPFIDPPKPMAIRDGYKTLFELGAIDDEQRITKLGRRLSQLPVDPRIGRIILAGVDESCLHELLIIASALEIRDPRERPVDKQQAADEAHAKFADEDSDFLSYVKLWDFYHNLRDTISRSQLRRACRQNFLSYNRMREWSDVHRQLLDLVERSGMKRGRRQPVDKSLSVYERAKLPANSATIHQALLTGLLVNVAFREKDFEYSVTGGGKAHLWPGSGVFKKKPKWIVAAEQIETSRRYLRTAGRISPEWIEPLAEHLVTRTYSEPFWSGQSGSAMAFEKVSLFGLPIVPRRGVRFGRIDPQKSRELLIQHGLVEGDIQLKAEFLQYNQMLEEEVESLQAKLRRHDLMLGDEVRFDFYDRRIPAEIYDVVRLKRWLKKEQRNNAQLLWMRKEDLMVATHDEVDAKAFPDSVTVNNIQIPLEYNLKPGTDQDGITLNVPQEALNQLDSRRLGWLVPGLLQEKIVVLIKSLPKPLRRALVPAPDTAKEVLASLRFGTGDFMSSVAEILGQMAGERIPVEAFDDSRLPAHLRMNVRVVGADGDAVASGRDLDKVRERVGHVVSTSFGQLDHGEWTRDGITAWDLTSFPAAVDLRNGGIAMKGYPCLIDCGSSVSLRLVDTPTRAARDTSAGIRRLFVLAQQRKLQSPVDRVTGLNKMLINAMTLPTPQVSGGKEADRKAVDFRAQLVDLTASRALARVEVQPRTPAAFKQLVQLGTNQISVAIQDVAQCIPPLMDGYQQTRAMLEAAVGRPAYAMEDMLRQLLALVQPGFLTSHDWGWLLQYPRYFQAIRFRCKSAVSNAKRDQQSTRIITDHWLRYSERLQQHNDRNVYDPQLTHYRWMIEELRVFMFARQLRTAISVSEELLAEQWKKVKP